MSITFSGRELLEIAIQIEKNGFTFYTHVARKVDEPKTVEVINWLAHEENSHIKRFEEILSRSKGEVLDMSPTEFEEYTLYLKALADARVFPSELKAREAASGIKSERDAINMAIEFEKDSLLFLHAMKEMIPVEDVFAVEELQREEMLHLKKLVGLKG